MSSRLKSPLASCLVVIGAYTVITCLVTYPVAFRMTTAMAGTTTDVEHHAWALWWAKKALVDLHTSPANLSSAFYLPGVYMPLHFTWPYLQLTAIPLLSIFGPVVVYNIEFLLPFILAGFTAYLLCHYLTGSRLAAFVGGCIYSFSSFHLVHGVAGHLAVAQIQWFPLYVLSMLWLLRTPRLKTAILAGVLWAFSLSVYTTYIGYFGILFPVAFLIYHLWADRQAVLKTRFLPYFLVSCAIAGMLIAPFLLPFAMEVLSGKSAYLTGLGTLDYSPDLFSFFVPSPYNPVFEKIGTIRSFAMQIAGGGLGPGLYERVVYVGWFALVLAFIGARVNLRRSGFWIVLGVGAAILSLGPFLRVGGHPAEYSLESTTSLIVMPYALLRKLPFFALDRTSGRLGVLLMLAVAVLAGQGLVKLLRGITDGRVKAATVLGLAFFIVGESIVMFPFPVRDASVPGFYLDLSHDSEDYAILDIPFLSGIPMYYQIYHQHQIVGAYLQRYPVEAWDMAHSLYSLGTSEDIIGGFSDRAEFLSEHGIRYVVVQKGDLSEEDSASWVSHLRGVLGEPIYEDGKICAFSVLERGQGMFGAWGQKVTLAGGWYDLELWDGVPTRWIGDEASIYLDSDQVEERMLKFRLRAFEKTRDLEIYVNDVMAGELQVSSEKLRDYTTSAFTLRRGRNVIRFGSQISCDSPSALGIGADDRCLSVGVQRMQLSLVNLSGPR